MTSSAKVCACHDDLGSTRATVPDDVLRALTGVSIPSISGILRRLGYPTRSCPAWCRGRRPRASSVAR